MLNQINCYVRTQQNRTLCGVHRRIYELYEGNWWVLDGRINSMPESKLIKPYSCAIILLLFPFHCDFAYCNCSGFCRCCCFFLCRYVSSTNHSSSSHKCSGRWLLFLPFVLAHHTFFIRIYFWRFITVMNDRHFLLLLLLPHAFAWQCPK